MNTAQMVVKYKLITYLSSNATLHIHCITYINKLSYYRTYNKSNIVLQKLFGIAECNKMRCLLTL